MNRLADIVRCMQSMGASPEMIAAVVEVATAPKSTSAERMAAKRARDGNAVTAVTPVTSVTSVTPQEPQKSAIPAAPRVGARAEPETTNSSEDQKKESKEASKSTTPSASRGTRMPPDFVPDIEAAVAEGLPHAEAEREAEKFRDWWVAAPGSKGLKANWPATWRTWYRKRIEDRAKTGPPRKGPSFLEIAQAARAHREQPNPDARTPPLLRLAK